MGTGDIINYNAELYISQDYLLANAGVGSGYLRVAKSRAGKGASGTWKHREILDKCYFAYDSLPASARYKLPAPVQLTDCAREVRNDYYTIVETAQRGGYMRFISLFKHPEAAIAAAVIHEAALYVSLHKLSFSKSVFFSGLADELRIQGLKYLPKTWRHLRDKVRDYASGVPVTDIITIKNIGNQNRTKHICNDTLKSWLTGLVESGRNYPAAYIFREVRRMSIQYGTDSYPCERWVSGYMNRPEVRFLTQQRYGINSRFNYKYRPYVPTQSALFAGDCWQVDGTRVNIIDHKAACINESGKKVTGQKFLYIVAVRDVMSGMVLGWDYCHKESAQAVINALAMAVRDTGYLPYEFVYDRFPGHNSQEWRRIESHMRMAGTVMTVTHKAEGKANIERWLDTLQTVFMTDSSLYYGEGIKSTRRYAHRSKEYVANMRKWANDNRFNYDDACKETDTLLGRYMDTPLSAYSRKFKAIDQSPVQLHTNSDKPNSYTVKDHTWCFLFGINKQVSVSNHMIKTDIYGVRRYYGIDDCGVIEKYTGVKLTNCFDPEDLSYVHLFDGDKHIGSFQEITPTQRFGPNKDMRTVGRLKAINEKVKAYRKAKRGQYADVEMCQCANDAINEIPEITGEVQKDGYSEASLLQGGIVHKYDCEAAETAFLLDNWQSDEDTDTGEVNVRNQY